jgi:hypothetical protein
LTDAKAGQLKDDEASWPEYRGLILDGFVYGRIADGPKDSASRLRWLHLQPDKPGYRDQPYTHLIAVLQQMGLEDQVADVAIAKQKDLYARGDLGLWDEFRNWVLYLVVDYGGPSASALATCFRDELFSLTAALPTCYHCHMVNTEVLANR